MDRKSSTALTLFMVITLVLTSCAGGQEEQLLATLNAVQTQNAQIETQAALNITQTAVEAAVQTAIAPTPTNIPTNTPEPTPTEEATATEASSPTASLTPTEEATPTPPPAPTSSGAVCLTEKTESGLNGVRVGNNSGQDFSITLRCSGGPCQDKSQTYYKCKFPPGTFLFYVWPGRYNISWTICGETESFVHPLNAQWYIQLKKCK